MIEKTVKNFSLSQICRSGQCFRMKERGKGSYILVAGDRYLEMEQEEDVCRFGCTPQEFETYWEPYFDLGRDYQACIDRIDEKDLYLTRAARLGGGIRILKQDLWEMIISFLISQQNNIKRIRKCIETLCASCGEPKEGPQGETYYAFPAPEALAGLSLEELKGCGLGYRSKYIRQTANAVYSGEADLSAVSQLSYQEAKKELLKLYGVGDKVADCICLFALHHLEAFPKDTHILQALKRQYKRGFPKRKYKGIEGILQQYMFYYELQGHQLPD